ncbi:transmembrane protein 87B-like [Amphiura filiformis]|uniref:transmembrane protein 87B-like n=1 Tax=Amphiura filiformis TaxID=82378 RepID=UPI003B225E95
MAAFKDRLLTICVCLILCVTPMRSLQTNLNFSDSLTLHDNSSIPLTLYGRHEVYKRTFHNETLVSISVRNCIGTGTYEISWVIRYMDCDIKSDTWYMDRLMEDETRFWYYSSAFPVTQTCGEKATPLRDESSEEWFVIPSITPQSPHVANSKRNAMEDSVSHTTTNVTFGLAKNKVTRVIRNGNYILNIYANTYSKNISQVDIEVEFQSANGFPSRYPDSVLLFYDGMCCVYILETIVWFVLIACNWKNLLRIHHLMSLVLFVSVLDSIFDAIHHDIMNRWDVNNAVLIMRMIFLKFVLSLRLLFMILFSLGDGVTKLKLSTRLCKVVSAATLILFIFASCTAVGFKFIVTDSNMTASIIVGIGALLTLIFGLVLVVWIFVNLVRTIRLLYKQHDSGKMILYVCVLIGIVLYGATNIAAIVWQVKTLINSNTCLHVVGILNVNGAFLSVAYSEFLLFVIVNDQLPAISCSYVIK